MKFHLNKNDLIKEADIGKFNTVLIHFVGGSYGNYIYRMIHRYFNGVPLINDDFVFQNGNSHKIYQDQYIDDYGPNDKKRNIICHKNIDFDFLIIKKHAHPKVNFKTFWLTPLAKYNIKISLPNKSLYAWAIIQNMIKANNLDAFTKNHWFDINWITQNNFDKYDYLEAIFVEFVNILHKSWHEETYNDHTYTIPLNEILNVEYLYEHFIKLAAVLNTSLTKNYQEFADDHQIFINNQLYFNSYKRYEENLLDKNILIDCLMKKFL